MEGAVPADLAVANSLRMVHELRQSKRLSRAELARRAGLAPPTVSRLVNRLLQQGLVRLSSEPSTSSVGRPALLLEFDPNAAYLLSCDVGNQSTRVALAGLDGRLVATVRGRTAAKPEELVRRIVRFAEALKPACGRPLAGVSVGVAAVVDAHGGVLREPPQHPKWEGYALGDALEGALQAPVIVEQDDHLAALAEASPEGTAPGASSVVLLQIGKGIGVGYCLGGQSVSGKGGRFGRVARWPVRSPVGDARRGQMLGDVLTSSGLSRVYLRLGGTSGLRDGRAVVEAASTGDAIAMEVMQWSGREIAALIRDLDALLAPEVVVFGGGLSASYHALRPIIEPLLPKRIDLRRSMLGDQAVLFGGVVILHDLSENYIAARIAESAAQDVLGGRRRGPGHAGSGLGSRVAR